MPELVGIDYLREFPDFERGNVSAATTFGLDRVLALLEEVGSPHLHLPVIHIAGTKGKGSTAASIARVLRAAGYRTGLFTQPHLISLFERFQIDGVEIADTVLSGIMIDTIRPAMRRLAARGITGIQQFEAQVAVALLWFAAQHVDAVVLEVGLGGRLDATNVVPAPLATALTPIGFDHTAILGDTLSLIAAEKAAIMKRGSVAVSSPQPPDAEQIFVDTSARLGVPLFLGGRDWHVSAVSIDVTGTTFDFEVSARMRDYIREHLPNMPVWWSDVLADGGSIANLRTPLLGAHQAVNAGCAVAVTLVVAPVLPKINLDAIRRGLARVEWPGRLQIISQTPVTVVDGAHTPESASVLDAAIRELFPGRRVILVCGIQADKDIPHIAGTLAGLAAHVVATRANHQRAAAASEIAAAFRSAGQGDVDEEDDPVAALELARRLADPNDLVLVTGSLYLVGDVLKAEAPRVDRGEAL